MDREYFMHLSEEEQAAALQGMETAENRISDLEAERDSFKTENKALKDENSKIKTELQRTKELNFTLARQTSREPHKSAEDILNDWFPNSKRR